MNITVLPLWANIVAIVAIAIIVLTPLVKRLYALYYGKNAGKGEGESEDETTRETIKRVYFPVATVITLIEGIAFLFFNPIEEVSFWLGALIFCICVTFTMMGAAGVSSCDKEMKPTEVVLMCVLSAAGLVMLTTLAFASITYAAIWLGSVAILSIVGYCLKGKDD